MHDGHGERVSTVANSHTRAALQSRGGCSSARALGFSFLAGRLILVTLDSPRSRKDKHVGRRQLTAGLPRFPGTSPFYSRACVSHTSVYICLWPVIPDEETENEGSKMPQISKSVTIQNSLFGRVVANRIRRFLHPSSSSVSTSSGDGGWEVSCELAHVHLFSLGGFAWRRGFCASTAVCASPLPRTNTTQDQTIANSVQIFMNQPTFSAVFRAYICYPGVVHDPRQREKQTKQKKSPK
ncbi:hypothetical protein B0H14DRAFT_222573 [Mycena olivaceomarginata]|nr:hypothetical protein B0H14DRAFT_222573 [Mycena olivaceomarginata]